MLNRSPKENVPRCIEWWLCWHNASLWVVISMTLWSQSVTILQAQPLACFLRCISFSYCKEPETNLRILCHLKWCHSIFETVTAVPTLPHLAENIFLSFSHFQLACARVFINNNCCLGCYHRYSEVKLCPFTLIHYMFT